MFTIISNAVLLHIYTYACHHVHPTHTHTHTHTHAHTHTQGPWQRMQSCWLCH